MGKKEESQEFSERKTLMKLQSKYDDNKHNLVMKELAYRRESDRLHHEREMERQRIKTAEIRKAHQRKLDFHGHGQRT